jgi:hypothetical protein
MWLGNPFSVPQRSRRVADASIEAMRIRLAPTLGVTMTLAVAVTLVAFTLRPRDVPTFAPTPPAPQEAPAGLVGPVLYTVDATAPETWRHFSLRLGSVVETAGSPHWDLGFRRYAIIAGPGAGILDLGQKRFEEVITVPSGGYQANEGAADPRNPAIAGWYEYGFFSHVLTPKRRVWAVRTADGRYAKLAMIGYYCQGAQPGCVTFRYAFQGDGSTRVAP